MWIIQVTTLWVEALLLEVQKKIVFNVSDIKATTLKVVPKSNFFLLNLEKVTIIENHHSVKHLGGMLVFGWTTYSPLLASPI